MALKEKLKSDLKSALKSKNGERVNTLRFILSSIQNKEIEKRGKASGDLRGISLIDEEVIEVLSKEAKKRKEAAEIYSKANRSDLANKEIKELEIIKIYLPEQLGEEEIKKRIQELLKQFDIKSPKDFGRVMGEVMKELKEKADASLVSRIIKSEIEKG